MSRVDREEVDSDPATAVSSVDREPAMSSVDREPAVSSSDREPAVSSLDREADSDIVTAGLSARARKYDCEALRKMLRGEVYPPFGGLIFDAQRDTKEYLFEFNNTYGRKLDVEGNLKFLRQFLGEVGDRTFIDAPFHCCLGFNIFIGHDSYVNRGAELLDRAPIRIGNFTKLGPGVHIYTPMHPIEREPSAPAEEFDKPVTIGNDCWIGGGAIILAGVRIGDGSTIGAGSVVTRDVPSNCVYAGNPARLLRKLKGAE